MKSLHISLITVKSDSNPSNFMSSHAQSLQIFLPLSTHLTPATTAYLQADNQSSTHLHSKCPNYFNLP